MIFRHIRFGIISITSKSKCICCLQMSGTDKRAKRLLLIREDVLPFYTVYHRIRGDRNLKQRSPFQLLNYLIFQRVKDFICYTYWFCRFLHSSQTIFLHKFKDSGYLKYYHLPLRSVAHCLQFQLLLPTEQRCLCTCRSYHLV